MCMRDLLRWGDEGPVAILEPEDSESIDVIVRERKIEPTLDEQKFDYESPNPKEYCNMRLLH